MTELKKGLIETMEKSLAEQNAADNTEAVEKLAGVAFKTYHPSNMCAQDWDSGAVLGGGDSYRKDMMRIAQAILAAIQADPLAYVKPKPLEWRMVDKDAFDAETHLKGRYRIRGFDDDYRWKYGALGKWSNQTTLEAAQAAAYEDLCNRVKELF